MEVDINVWAVAGAAVAAMIVGAIWYSNGVFGATWLKMSTVSKKQWDTMGWMPMVYMFIFSLVMAYVLAHMTYLAHDFFEVTYMNAALSTAFWMWLGFVVPTTVGGGLFEVRRKKLLAINAGNWLATLLAMALVIGWVGV